MVAGPLIAIGAVVAGLIFFKDDISEFFANLNPIGKTQEAVSGAGAAVFDFGKQTRANLDKQILQTNIKAKEAEIVKQANQAGFASLSDFEKATDTCRLVVGGSRNVCDVGLIGVDDTKLTQRFGGKTGVGTDTTKIMGTTIVKPQALSEKIAQQPQPAPRTRGSARFGR